MASAAEEKVRVKVDDEVEFLLTQEQLRLMEIKEGDSFYSCITSCNENSFEEFDSAMSLPTEQEEKSFTQQYEDITPVPSENEMTPTTSFAEGTPGAKSQTFTEFATPSPRKLEAIALVSARFNLIHPPEINICPPTPLSAPVIRNQDAPEIDTSIPSDTPLDSVPDVNPADIVEPKIPVAPSDEAKSSERKVINGRTPTSLSCGDENRRPQIGAKLSASRTIRPPTKSRTSKESCASTPLLTKSDQLDASLDINVMSSRLMKNPRPKKLQEQSFKGSPVHLSKLVTPNKAKVTSKVAEFIRNGTPSTLERKGKDTPSMKNVPSASRIPRKCFIQSARVFGKQVIPENLMKSPKPLITIHKHEGSDKSRQIHINESVYETFEANAVKKC